MARILGCVLILLVTIEVHASPPSNPTVNDLVVAVRARAKQLESASGMKHGYQAFSASYQLTSEDLPYSDYVIARLLFEATRDAGFWNLHWKITNREPNSDLIWKQWKSISKPSAIAPTAIAECDELSALYSFLVLRAGVHGMGLFWPYSNHTVAVWVIKLKKGSDIRVVIPTTQIFLEDTDFFGTRRFNPWKQRSITEYRRQDVPASFELPKALFDFFLQQIDRYAAASDTALQRIRYLRDGAFNRQWTAEAAAESALKLRLEKISPEDSAAYQHFAEDMRSVR